LEAYAKQLYADMMSTKVSLNKRTLDQAINSFGPNTITIMSPNAIKKRCLKVQQ